MPYWLDFLARVMAILGLAIVSYQAIKRAHADESWSAVSVALSTAIFTLYVCGAVAIVIFYGVLLAWDSFFVFLAAAALYIIGGFYLSWKLMLAIQAKYPPKNSA